MSVFVWKGIGRSYGKFRRRQVYGRKLPRVDMLDWHLCRNCGHRFAGKYCNRCGQEFRNNDTTQRMVTRELIQAATSFDSNFFFTSYELLFRPGYLIRDYLNGKRVRYISPFLLIFILSTLYLLFSTLSGVGKGAGNIFLPSMSIVCPDIPELKWTGWLFSTGIMKMILQNSGLLILISFPMWIPSMYLAFWNKKNRLSLAEWMVASGYISALLLLVSLFFEFFSLLAYGAAIQVNPPFYLTFVLILISCCQLLELSIPAVFARLLLAYLFYILGILAVLLLIVMGSVLVYVW